ncbi:MAG: hypothetical protein ACYSWU_12290 [Planctomycetota bacterium]
MSDKLEEAKKLAQIHYESGSTSAVYVATSGIGTDDNPEEPIKLIEVNDDTLPSGIVPLRFGPLPDMGVAHTSTIIEVTQDEFRRIESGDLQLPEGWENRTLIPRPETASTDQ